MKVQKTLHKALLLAAGLAVAPNQPVRAADAVRVTPTVELIRKVKGAVVPVFSFGENDQLNSGAGAVIHPNGFILTADHVTQDREGVVLFGYNREPYKVVGRLPEKDLAVLKVAAPKPREFLVLGRSDEVMEGETVLAIGNPGGRGIVYSQGIVSCANMDPTWPSALSQTFWRSDSTPKLGRDDYIQFDAASNRGNSGGPLINAAGELIGIVARKQNDEEAINWAIPVDRARRYFNYLVQPEETEDFWAGVEVDFLSPKATVTAVTKDSPAAKAGLAVGDQIVSLNGVTVRNGPDWLLALTDHKAGAKLRLQYQRGTRTKQTSLVLAPFPTAPCVSKEGKSQGLRYAFYRPKAGTALHAVPNFSTMKPLAEGVVSHLNPDDFVPGTKENYAVVFRGYLEFPAAGCYRVILTSDDGSKCYLNDRLVVDSDYGHPAVPLSRAVRVAAGLVPVRIEYFENRGERALKLEIQAMDQSGQPVSDATFYRD